MLMNPSIPNYLNPELKPGLARVSIPMVIATADSLTGFGELIDGPDSRPVEIVRWPAAGWRPVDLDSGDEGGTKEGIFVAEWKGDILYGRNEAVGGHYILGYSVPPESADENHACTPSNVLLWHANYHPDGGQLFFPLERRPFVVPLALPGDDIRPEDFICFWFDGSQGLYIHPNIWHEGVFPISGSQRFFDRQGAVHARVSIDFAREFDCLLNVSLEAASAL
ncbi:MAG: ureidoglycolate lyase [Planctomycetota bacterium]